MKVVQRCELALASGSPRRAELLRLLGVEFIVRQAAIDESPLVGEAPAQTTLRLALEKALAVSAPEDRVAVIGGDTIVVLDQQMLGKPADKTEAAQMLRRLAGRTHHVYSAVAVVRGVERHTLLSSSAVTFAQLGEEQIAAYCASGEPLDKAGAYGIQGLAGAFVRRVEGSCSGIVGLPLWETRQLLLAAGVIQE